MRLFGTDIQEKGKVVVCSYERLNELQCYQFLLNVLKVIAAKNISPILTPLMAVRFAWRFCLPAAPYSEMLKGYEKGLIHLLLSAYLPGTDQRIFNAGERIRRVRVYRFPLPGQ